MPNPTRIEILGVPVDCVNMTTAVKIADQMINSGKQNTIVAVNPEKIIRAHEDSELLNHLRNTGLLIPDGIGAVWAARILERRQMGRVPGSELMPELCALAASRGYRVFLYGARPHVVARAAEVLVQRYPSLEIAGTQDGYLPADRQPGFQERLRALKVDIIFVALGSPAQENWMRDYFPETSARLCQGVGGTFDVLAGEVQRAPRLFRALNLEWFYRLVTNPRRIQRQTALPKFVLAVLLEAVRKRGAV